MVSFRPARSCFKRPTKPQGARWLLHAPALARMQAYPHGLISKHTHHGLKGSPAELPLRSSCHSSPPAFPPAVVKQGGSQCPIDYDELSLQSPGATAFLQLPSPHLPTPSGGCPSAVYRNQSDLDPHSASVTFLDHLRLVRPPPLVIPWLLCDFLILTSSRVTWPRPHTLSPLKLHQCAHAVCLSVSLSPNL